MRSLVIITTLIAINLFCFGQRKINGYILDSVTNKPLLNIGFHILKDKDQWIDVGETDSSGYFKGRIESNEINKKPSYQVYVDNDEYYHALVDVTVITDKDTVQIKLRKNENYIPKIQGKTYRDCSSISFGDYEPREPETLSDLPVNIKEKVSTHIKERVGNDLYSRLLLTGGQIVDLDRLEKIENFSKEYHWKPYSYYLCFSFSDTALGIARFTAKIVLDKDGNVVEEIQLPYINHDLSKARIMNMKQAIKIAAKNNYSEKDSYIDFDYDKKEDCFVWTFEKSFYSKDHSMYTDRLIISASSGKILSNGTCCAGVWD